MKDCKHNVVVCAAWRDGQWQGPPPGVDAFDWLHAGNFDRRVCGRCGEWLPLGPSNDEPVEVLIEIRAVELLTRYRSDSDGEHFLDWTLDEMHGWRDRREIDGNECPCSNARCRHIVRNWDTGYLAGTIHDTPEAP